MSRKYYQAWNPRTLAYDMLRWAIPILVVVVYYGH